MATDICALVVAAGSGDRFGGAIPKQYASLGGRSVLRRSIDRLRENALIERIVVVIQPSHREHYEVAVAGLSLEPPIEGGQSRQDSVRRGLEALREIGPRFVLIHDAARPLIENDLLDSLCINLEEGAGVIPALPLTDTIHRGNAFIEESPDRAGLWRAQTPQAFDYQAILAAHRSRAGKSVTDDAALAHAAGMTVKLVQGSERNFKITTQDDLVRAEHLLAPQLSDVRTGLGFDVHRFTAGAAVMLCGVSIPHDRALEGHSDADVALHALTDALLGTIGAGDIGEHFPPSDDRWKGADSTIFLKHAAGLIAARGGTISNIDLMLICEQPKIGPYRPTMVARLAHLLGLALDRVSVKATTSERLGFIGRGEGIAAQAVATVRLPDGAVNVA